MRLWKRLHAASRIRLNRRNGGKDQSPDRVRLRIEHLEDRTLLSQDPSLVVVTHGFSILPSGLSDQEIMAAMESWAQGRTSVAQFAERVASSAPPWLQSVARNLANVGRGVGEAIVNLGFVSQLVRSFFDATFPPWVKDVYGVPIGTRVGCSESQVRQDRCDHVITLNWADESNDPVTRLGMFMPNGRERTERPFESAANRLIGQVRDKVNRLAHRPGSKVDVLFIGHSFGTVVNQKVLRMLERDENRPTREKLDYVQVVQLDPVMPTNMTTIPDQWPSRPALVNKCQVVTQPLGVVPGINLKLKYDAVPDDCEPLPVPERRSLQGLQVALRGMAALGARGHLKISSSFSVY